MTATGFIPNGGFAHTLVCDENGNYFHHTIDGAGNLVSTQFPSGQKPFCCGDETEPPVPARTCLPLSWATATPYGGGTFIQTVVGEIAATANNWNQGIIKSDIAYTSENDEFIATLDGAPAMICFGQNTTATTWSGQAPLWYWTGTILYRYETGFVSIGAHDPNLKYGLRRTAAGTVEFISVDDSDPNNVITVVIHTTTATYPQNYPGFASGGSGKLSDTNVCATV